ncbi:pyridoxal phosphate-dependent aminotransferase [Taibaiella koreensis]|uniref:pyridoxal phosphate-dependent aminotransferase n=1 Tax=Taibaiella koreensis TaxID=1268548 RepID=UPI000E59E55F|nr:pyridoxal phosphate-dependent aminotransferase [Taibaiella koreensis]
MQLAKRLDRISEPQTILMAKLGRELKAKGVQVIDLSLGEPDFKTPQHIIDAADRAMEEGYTKYPPIAGFPELRQAIVTKLQRDNHLEYTPEQIIVSTGAKQVLANAILSIVNPGDEAIIPTPFWVTYASLVSLAEGKNVFVPCGIEDHFKITPAKLEAAITKRTRLFIFSSPCNPSGAVYSKEELKALAGVFEKYPDIVIISDEIYEYINYVGKHESIAQFEAIKDRVVLVNGFSKGFAMTGWRLGYMAGPVELVKACDKLQSQFTSGANSIAERAAITALLADLTPSFDMVKAFKERKEFIIPALQAIDGVRISDPEGAFYAFPDISSFYGKSNGAAVVNNADDMAMYLLNTAHVIGVSGAAFGDEHCIRFSFAASMETLQEGVRRLKEALDALH